MRLKFLALVLFVASVLPVLAGGQVSVRLVAMLPGNASDSVGVDDVLGALKKNIGEHRYLAEVENSINLPANKQEVPMVEVSVIGSGDKDNFQIEIRRKNKAIINTTVKLDPGKPFILGGIDGKKGKYILVFVIR
jgi:hypothetical protein